MLKNFQRILFSRNDLNLINKTISRKVSKGFINFRNQYSFIVFRLILQHLTSPTKEAV